MILNEAMVDKLHAIRRIETRKINRILNVPAQELGNCLIRVYYSSKNLQTRELISAFMLEAGVVWQRKLISKDTSPIASSVTRFASLNDYMALLAANDPSGFENLAC